MSLPTSRNTSYSASSPVKSADLNDMQDCIVGAKHGDVTLSFVPHNLAPLTNWSNLFFGFIQSTGATTSYISPPLREGDRVKSLTVARYGDASADLDIGVRVYKADGTNVVLGTAALTNPAASWVDTTIDLTDTTLGVGDALVIFFGASAANIRLGPCRLTYDHP